MNKTLYIKRLLQAVAVLAVLTLTSCEHKELCQDNLNVVNVKVVFDWQKAPDAAPASMSLYLYPSGGGEALRYELTDRNGGTIRVPFGDYDAFCLNSDTENITYRNTESKPTFEVTTRTADLLSGLTALGVQSAGVPRAKGTEDERVVLPPDMLWSDQLEGIKLEQGMADPTITLYPEMSVCRYTVEIRKAKNLEFVSGLSGSITGLAGGLLPGVGADALTGERVTVPFDAVADKGEDGAKTVITGGLLTFGHPAGGKHILSVYVVLADGSKHYRDYDVTDQIHSAPDPRNVHIILDGFSLPKPIFVDGGGFQPEVDAWQTVPIEIPM